MQEDTLDMPDAKALNNAGWKHTRCKGTPKNLLELHVQAAYSQLLKVELFVLEELGCNCAALASDLQTAALL